jgi:hypothetical protein
MLAACAKGGGNDRPASEVTIAASHQMFGSRGRPSFNKFPVDPAFMLSDVGTLTLANDSTYTVQQGSGTSAPQGYAIAKDATFTITVPLAGRAPTHFIGAYSLEGDTLAYFFTDRFAPSATGDAVGLIWGTRHTGSMPDLEGDWHVFSLHVIFAPANSSQVAGNVGRAVGGTLSIDSAGDITGSGKESTTQDVTFTGSSSVTANGAVTLELDYKIGATTDTRGFAAGVSNTVILGLDEEETDGETGLVGLLRKRTGTKDLTKLAGTYAVGMQTIFVNPVRAGIDAAYGSITFDETDGFELKATGQQNGQAAPFTYTGKYTLADDGTLVLTIPDTQETWMGAVDQDYKVLLIADNFVEVRTGSELPELNLVLGIRRP